MELCEAMLVAGCGVLLGEFFAIREELELLRQYRAAHLAHAAAKQDLQDIYRKHAIERAWEAERFDAAVALAREVW